MMCVLGEIVITAGAIHHISDEATSSMHQLEKVV